MSSAQHEPIYAATALPDDPPPVPVATGRTFAVAAGHRLAADAALEIYDATGNAVDAAMAGLLASAVLEPHLFGLGGEVTGLIHANGSTRVLAGATRAPARMTIDAFRQLDLPYVPSNGLLAAGPPAVLPAVTLALAELGSGSFDLIATPAIRLAEEGFELDPVLVAAIEARAETFLQRWPTSAEVWMPDGVPPSVGSTVRQPALARTLRRIGQAWTSGGADGAAFELVKGFVATEIADFVQTHPNRSSHRGFMTADDLATFTVRWEEPIRWTDRHGRTICKAGTWTQGMVLLQTLAVMEHGGWDRLEPQSGDYLHAFLESAKLCLADREGYYGDPDLVRVPVDELLSDEYIHARTTLVDPDRAGSFPPGEIAGFAPWHGTGGDQPSDSTGDTTHIDVIDANGFAISVTPSGGWFSSPVIPALGFPLGTRCQTFWLDGRHPNALVPGKRPRTTLTPTLVLEGDVVRYALGTPGGDSQDQIQAQILHALAWNVRLADAVDLPTVTTEHHPSSFAGHHAVPLGVLAESRVPAKALDHLRDRRHRINMRHSWSLGRPSVVEARGSQLLAAASRRLGTAGARAS